MYFFPKDLKQNLFFKNILYVIYKEYLDLKNNYLIINNNRCSFPRLSSSNKRGKIATIELLQHIKKKCNIYDDLDYTILFKISNIRNFENSDGLYYIEAEKQVFNFNYLSLKDGVNNYNEQVKIYMESSLKVNERNKLEMITNFISSLDLSIQEIMLLVNNITNL